MANNAIVTLVGNLTGDPVMRDSAKSGQFCSFNIAVSTANKDAQGNYITNFYSCSAYGSNAELIMNKGQKGSRFTLSGSMALVDYKKKDGTTGQSLNCYVSNVIPIDRLKGSSETASASSARPNAKYNNTTNYDKPAPVSEEDDVMPF